MSDLGAYLVHVERCPNMHAHVHELVGVLREIKALCDGVDALAKGEAGERYGVVPVPALRHILSRAVEEGATI